MLKKDRLNITAGRLYLEISEFDRTSGDVEEGLRTCHHLLGPPLFYYKLWDNTWDMQQDAGSCGVYGIRSSITAQYFEKCVLEMS